jgi:hypothetical protein
VAIRPVAECRRADRAPRKDGSQKPGHVAARRIVRRRQKDSRERIAQRNFADIGGKAEHAEREYRNMQMRKVEAIEPFPNR